MNLQPVMQVAAFEHGTVQLVAEPQYFCGFLGKFAFGHRMAATGKAQHAHHTNGVVHRLRPSIRQPEGLRGFPLIRGFAKNIAAPEDGRNRQLAVVYKWTLMSESTFFIPLYIIIWIVCYYFTIRCDIPKPRDHSEEKKSKPYSSIRLSVSEQISASLLQTAGGIWLIK